MELFKAGSPMVRCCMPWRYRGEIELFWTLFALRSSDEMRADYSRWALANGINTLTFFLNNPDGRDNNLVSFFGPDLQRDYADWTKLDSAMAANLVLWCALWRDRGLSVVPTIWCDDGGLIVTKGWDVQERFISQCLRSLNPLVDGYIIGCETNRWGSDRVAGLYAACKRYTDKPVGNHWQGYGSPRTDFLAWEHPYPMNRWEQQTASSVAAQGATIIAQTVEPVVFLEYHVDPDKRLAKDMTRALAALPGCAGVGGIG